MVLSSLRFRSLTKFLRVETLFGPPRSAWRGARGRREPPGVDEIVSAGLCIGCGLCQSVAGPERVRLVRTSDGRERPVALAALDRATRRRINQVCPGVLVTGGPRDRRSPATPVDPVWGPATRVAVGHAVDPELRFRAASGGVLTALAEFLLDSGQVEFVVHVAASRRRPMLSGRHLSIDRAGLLRAAGSRYGPAAPLLDFCELLDRERPFALVGKPCDISAVRNLARHDPRVDRHLRYTLALVCGGASELLKTREAVHALGLDEEALSLVRYRGHGNPGLARFETRDGMVRELTYNEMWSDESTWRLQSRCTICPDAIGEAADVVAADCWEGGSPQGEDAGHNAIIVRTRPGAELLQAAVAAGRLALVRDIGFRDLDRFQPHQVVKKRAVWARLTGIRLAGGRATVARGLRIRRLGLTRHPRELAREASGAAARLRRGRYAETPPRAGDGSEPVWPAD